MYRPSRWFPLIVDVGIETHQKAGSAVAVKIGKGKFLDFLIQPGADDVGCALGGSGDDGLFWWCYGRCFRNGRCQVHDLFVFRAGCDQDDGQDDDRNGRDHQRRNPFI